MTGEHRDLSIRNLSVGYDRTDVLHDITIDVRHAQVTAILGANGAGKTTLIRAIMGLTPPRTGDILFDGVSLNGLAPHRICRMGITTIPEGNRVFPRMTVLENLQVGGLGLRDRETKANRLEELFQIFPRLRERQGQLAGMLSGGERSMLSIARGLMPDPELVILDEPSLGLSPLFVSEVFKIVLGLRERGITVLLVEQNVRQTLDVADYGYVLTQGRVAASGPASHLRNDEELRMAYFGTADERVGA